MVDLRVKTGTSSIVLYGADGTLVDARSTRDGALFSAPWLTALAFEGRCFGINTGTGTTPSTAWTSFTATTPSAYVAVPAGTTIIPVYIEVVREETTTAGVVDCMAVLSAVTDTSAGGTVVTIHNMRTDDPRQSNCVATKMASTVTTPYTGNYLEFWRGNAGIAEDAYTGATAPTSELNVRTYWCIGDALAPPVIVGTGSLSVYACQANATAATGWITVIWAEIPSNSIV